MANQTFILSKTDIERSVQARLTENKSKIEIIHNGAALVLESTAINDTDEYIICLTLPKLEYVTWFRKVGLPECTSMGRYFIKFSDAASNYFYRIKKSFDMSLRKKEDL